MVARKHLEATPVGHPERAEALSNAARSLLDAGYVEEGLAKLEELRTTSGNSSAILGAARQAIPLFLGRGDLEAVERWLPTLEQIQEAPGNIKALRAELLLQRNDLGAAQEEIRLLVEGDDDGGVDVWHLPFDPATALNVAARVALARGDFESALRHVRRVINEDLRAEMGVVLATWLSAGLPLVDLALEVGPGLLQRSLVGTAHLRPAVALAWYDALRQTRPTDPRFVMAGCVFASRFGWQVALQWSQYARELSLNDIDPLRTMTAEANTADVDRAMAAALLVEIDGDPADVRAFETAFVDLSPDARGQVIDLLEDIGVSTASSSAASSRNRS